MISPQVSVYSDLYILGLYGDRAALMISPQVSVYSDLYILGLYGDRAALMISPQVRDLWRYHKVCTITI
jgi:hypothetical protein